MLIYPPGMSMNWIQTYAFLSNIIKSGNRLWPLNLSSPYRKQSKQTLFYVPWTVKDRTHGPALRNWLCYSGHRVALVAHRAQKSVPDSAGEWPTFLPPPLESCSGTANVDGPNSTWFWIELPENCCEPLKFIIKYISIQFCERPGHGRPFHALHNGDNFAKDSGPCAKMFL